LNYCDNLYKGSERPIQTQFIDLFIKFQGIIPGMAVWQDRSQTKKTGGKTRSYRKSRKYDLGSKFSEPEVGEQRVIVKDTRGGNQKSVAKRSETVNLSVNGEVKKAESRQRQRGRRERGKRKEATKAAGVGRGTSENPVLAPVTGLTGAGRSYRDGWPDG
jgi:hypothetical protein